MDILTKQYKTMKFIKKVYHYKIKVKYNYL